MSGLGWMSLSERTSVQEAAPEHELQNEIQLRHYLAVGCGLALACKIGRASAVTHFSGRLPSHSRIVDRIGAMGGQGFAAHVPQAISTYGVNYRRSTASWHCSHRDARPALCRWPRTIDRTIPRAHPPSHQITPVFTASFMCLPEPINHHHRESAAFRPS